MDNNQCNWPFPVRGQPRQLMRTTYFSNCCILLLSPLTLLATAAFSSVKEIDQATFIITGSAS